jgi:hypothetical protein
VLQLHQKDALGTEQRFQIAAAVNHAKNQHIPMLHAVNNPYSPTGELREHLLAELFGGPSALRLLFGPEARAAPVFHFFGKFAHGLFVERTSLTSRQRGFGIIDRREKFRTLPFAFFPLPQGFLVGREKHFHAHSVRAPQASVKRSNVGAPTFSWSAAGRRRFAITTRPPNDRPTAIPTASL